MDPLNQKRSEASSANFGFCPKLQAKGAKFKVLVEFEACANVATRERSTATRLLGYDSSLHHRFPYFSILFIQIFDRGNEEILQIGRLINYRTFKMLEGKEFECLE